MFFPTGDTPNPRNYIPWVTWGIIALNISIYLFVNLPLTRQAADLNDPRTRDYINAFQHLDLQERSPQLSGQQINKYDVFVFENGYKAAAPEWSDLFIALFLHGGFMHLFGNMLFLFIYGDNVEHRLGRLGFLFTYLFTGVIATLFFCVFAQSSMIPLVGASGAISGILGLYFIMFPKNKVKLFVFLFPFIMNVFLVPARYVLAAYLLLENLIPFFLNAGSSVAYGAHIGGFIAGAAIAFGGERLNWSLPEIDTIRNPKAPCPVEHLHELRASIAQHEVERALALYFGLPQEQKNQVLFRNIMLLCDWMIDLDYLPEANHQLRKSMALKKTSEEEAEISLLLGELRLKQDQEASAFKFLQDALNLSANESLKRRARIALAHINYYRSK